MAVAHAATPASHDPNQTATILVDGFDPDGASETGVYGEDRLEPQLQKVAGLVGLPTAWQPGGVFQPNVVTATSYYGDTPPPYYDDTDRAEIDTVTARWGGGVPRYALIVGKYARYVLERSGARQVNFVSGSFGALIVRWLIEKDVEGLASSGSIARWLSVEGVVDGNWLASQPGVVQLLQFAEMPSIDVEHMRYRWIEAHLHSPRQSADSPHYSGILIGQWGSSDDRANGRAITLGMLAAGEFQPNDGLQGYQDTRFSAVAPGARFLGLPPTSEVFHVTHAGIRDDRGAWAQAIIFITQSRRVTITMTRARVQDLHEPSGPLLDWRPAEVVFDSRVRSPEVERRWGITRPVCERRLEGAVPPVHRFRRGGDEVAVSEILFDDLVLATETRLDLQLAAAEIDLDPRYGISEPATSSRVQGLGGGVLTVPVTGPGTYAFQAGDWSCEIAVSVFDYPFAPAQWTVSSEMAARAASAVRVPGKQLVAMPNPFRREVKLLVPARGRGSRTAGSVSGPTTPSAAPDISGTLNIYDAAGRWVRSITAPVQEGFRWDGRDARGNDLPAGIYFQELSMPDGRSFVGRTQRIR